MCGAISRVMSFKTIICLGRLLPAASSDLPGDRTGRPMVSIFGLASDGVYMATCCYQRHGGLLHRLFTLTTFVAVIFCCTFLRVTSTGRYPASCPVKPGLSSPAVFRHLQPRSFILLNRILIMPSFTHKCKGNLSLAPIFNRLLHSSGYSKPFLY